MFASKLPRHTTHFICARLLASVAPSRGATQIAHGTTEQITRRSRVDEGNHDVSDAFRGFESFVPVRDSTWMYQRPTLLSCRELALVPEETGPTSLKVKASMYGASPRLHKGIRRCSTASQSVSSSQQRASNSFHTVIRTMPNVLLFRQIRAATLQCRHLLLVNSGHQGKWY